MVRKICNRLIWIALIATLPLGCTQPAPGIAPAPSSPRTPTYTPFQPLQVASAGRASETPADTTLLSATRAPPSPAPAAIPSPLPGQAPQNTAGQAYLWIDPRLPDGFRSALALPAGYLPAGQAEGADLRLEPGAQARVSQWVYALVAPFPTLAQGISTEELRQAWTSGPLPGGPFAGSPLLVDESTWGMFSAIWGEPAPGATQVLPSAELLDFAWERQPAWGIVPFEAVEPRWAVLEVDGQSPLHKEFDLASYPLVMPISLGGQTSTSSGDTSWVPVTNRDPSRLTVLAMTGVTALVRATAFTMEQRGVKYPGKDVGEWLRQADLTHISNEVPFSRNCPFPDPLQPGMRFCSDARYIGLLEDIGTDIVELSGDHFQDWGDQAMLYTLDLYRERGWSYYGGGADLEDGRRALLIEHNGNRLAFIGCNGKGGSYAQARANHPGAVPCDFDWMQAEIARLRAEGYLPIVTFQHFEYYTFQAQPDQERDFRRMAQAGAVVVSGSQAHQPQALEFSADALIHYGLGNLFFDQYDVSEACRQAFIDRHVFYGGRYIGAELLPILFVDYARPRPMTPSERADLLRKVFKASGW
ncbi:MAG TPA: CapA family protein [Anaerolineales bacterium]|nr:CapA family protein [Anaerolineales bacterium]